MLGPWRDHPDTAGIFTDFDGTLAPIVADPGSARPVDGAVEVLGGLADGFAVVGILSGRPVEFLQRFFASPPLVLSGVYGLEVVRDGERVDYADAARWAPVIDDAVVAARAELPAGARVESKGLSMTLHFREHPDVQPAIEEWAARRAASHGLHVRRARMSVELHPPVDTDKGTAVLDLAVGLEAVCFAGDDLGDLPAFDALDRLAAAGVATLRIGVRSEESPPDVLDRADVVVDGPTGALDFLRSFSRQ